MRADRIGHKKRRDHPAKTETGLNPTERRGVVALRDIAEKRHLAERDAVADENGQKQQQGKIPGERKNQDGGAEQDDMPEFQEVIPSFLYRNLNTLYGLICFAQTVPIPTKPPGPYTRSKSLACFW